MANEADLKLIQIPEFPKTDTLVGSGPEYVVLTKSDGITYGMLTEDFKSFLGTVQVQVPKALAPTDPAPTLDGVYEPTVDGSYSNAGGLERLSTDGYVRFIKNGATWVKANTPLPQAENKIPKWQPAPYAVDKQVTHFDQFWGAVEPTLATDVPGVSQKWVAIGKGEKGDNGKSNYDLWLEAGNTGSLATYLASLKGAPGVVPASVAVDIQQAKDEANTALQTAQDVREEFDQVVANANTSNPEVVSARAGATNLKVRIDAVEENSISPARVLSTLPSPMSVGLSNTGFNRRPFVTFTDDDGFMQYYTTMAPMLEAKGFVGCPAIVTGWTGGTSPLYMRPYHCLELQERGHEILSHSVNHLTNFNTSASQEEIDFESRVSKETLISWGLQVETIIYPGGQSGGANGTEVIKRYYRSGWASGEAAGVYTRHRQLPNQFESYRIAVNNDTSLAVLKAQIDACLIENSWVVFMTHANTFDSAGWAKLQELIDYVYAQGVEVGTMKQGLDIFGNSLDVGSRRHLKILAGGEVVSNFIGSEFKSRYQGYLINENTHLREFDSDKKTYSIFRAEDGGVFPEQNYGVLETWRSTVYPGWSHQIWKPTGSKNSYKRSWVGTVVVGNWSAWVKDGYLTVSPSTPLDNTPFSDILTGVTLSNVTAANSAGFPASSEGGTLLTFKVASSSFLKQIWFPLGKNDMYVRSFGAGDSKGAFSKYIKEIKHNFIVPTTNVPANGSAVVEIDLTAIVGASVATQTTGYVLSSRSQQTSLMESLIYNSMIRLGVLRIRLYNPTAAAINLQAATWDILIFQ